MLAALLVMTVAVQNPDHRASLRLELRNHRKL